ncbi:ATP-dependent helicase [Paeniglutamicibacter cryotolerans]|uniref:DNA 3'-5' helicase n=1 Tax=Paeniglutamicibacter cryotolerans TaxID=670079 RepID=A0A839QK27_9MICC|nr:ATP-dependent DNA helicase [Paeniglutamicibacter cryotolerans]MBB2996559.1 DNA helicase-2/ATP-dependent DNA helicase PcrA [Paeniglutamicibacter cryotolerans]
MSQNIVSQDAETQPTPRFTPEELATLLGQHQPTKEQSSIISSPLEPLLVVAGAGSGKTATMADRVVWLVANGQVKPEQILGVTFTRKAAGELAQRIRGQLEKLARSGLLQLEDNEVLLDPSVSTYHSYANTLVQDHGLRIGVEPDTVLLGSAQAWQLAAEVVDAYTGDYEHLVSSKSTLIDSVVTFASECAEHLVDPLTAKEWTRDLVAHLESLPYRTDKKAAPSQEARKLLDKLRTRVTISELATAYATAKAERGVLDYGDLVALAARIARTVPAAADAERSRFKVVLLDEFQDTSHAQMVLFSCLYAQGHAVTAVGDPNQSIYGFRGASAGQLFRFPEEFPAVRGENRAPAAVAFLTTAWRNSKNVLEAANAISAPLNMVDPNHGSARVTVPPLVPSPFAGDGVVELCRHPTTGTEASALAARFIAERQRFLAEHGRTPTMSVLCRTRGQLAPIAQGLAEAGIPYEIVGLGGLLGMPEITDLVSTLRVLVEPGRSDALLRLISGARWRLGPADLMAFADWSRFLARRRDHAIRSGAATDVETADSAEGARVAEARAELNDAASLIEALDWLPHADWVSSDGRSLSTEGLSRLTRLRDEIRYLRGFVDDDLDSLLREAERSMLLDIEVAAKPGVGIHEARRHLDAFADVADDYARSGLRVDLLGFLTWLDAAAEQEGGLAVIQPEASPDTVQLLTIHASKGLEWDVVAVTGLNEGIFPTARDSRWTSGDSSLPWPLRGDRHDLPQWDTDQPSLFEALKAEGVFKSEVLAHGEDEERRLAYVALTRARTLLLCSATAWTGTRTKMTAPSRFMSDLLPLAEGQRPSAHIADWVEDDQAPEENPFREEPLESRWPYDPLEGPIIVGGGTVRPRRPGRRAALETAARSVIEATAALREEPEAGIVPATEQGNQWANEAELLVRRAETDQKAQRQAAMPQHVRASVFVDLATDAKSVVDEIRRPVPRRPGTAARRGTAFHAWLEEYFDSTGMLDLGDFMGAADAYIEDALGLEDMKAAFLASEWADRQPEIVEVAIETRIGPVSVRGRIDAVFRDPDGSWLLVDWKTGRVPSGEALRIKSLQLAVYRLGWARLKGIDVQDVKAAFYYVAQGKTIRPHDLADEADLEELVRTSMGQLAGMPDAGA